MSAHGEDGVLEELERLLIGMLDGAAGIIV